MSNTPKIDPDRLDAWMQDSLKRRDSKYTTMESINAEMLEALEELLECVLEPTHPLALAVAINRANRVIAKAKGEQL